MFKFIVRFIIKPFVAAMRDEMSWHSGTVQLEEELRRQIESVSKDQLKILLDDKLSHEVFDLVSRVDKMEAYIKALHGAVKKQNGTSAEVDGKVDTVRNEISVLGRIIRAVQQEETKKFFEKDIVPKPVEVEEIDFGG